jgi:hypothetical protein
MDGGYQHAEDFSFHNAAESDSVVPQKKTLEDQRPARADGIIIAEPDCALGEGQKSPEPDECPEALGGHRLSGRGAVFRPFPGNKKGGVAPKKEIRHKHIF